MRPSSDQWNACIAAHHYLGYTPLTGAQMRYTAYDRTGYPLAMLGFAAPAWQLAPRDRCIGWSPQTRQIHRGRTLTPGFPEADGLQHIDFIKDIILTWVSVILGVARRRGPWLIEIAPFMCWRTLTLALM